MPGKGRILKEMFTGRSMRVAVLGASGSGKTTFIVSLCQLLQNPSDSPADLNGWTPSVEQELRVLPPYKHFPRADVLAAWKNNSWPSPTVDVSMLRLPVSFHRGEKSTKRFELQILDIPGERVADFAMFGKNYREWSEFVERHADGMEARIAPLEQYFKTAREIITDATTKMANKGLKRAPEYTKAVNDEMKQLFQAYKTALSLLEDEYSTFLSPSIVKLDQNGKHPTWETGLLGLDEQRQFVPLPTVVWSKANRPLIRTFEKAYNAYVERIVAPVVKWLASADKSVYLVDVLTLLNDGCAAYATQKAMGDAAISVFSRRGRTAFGRAWEWLFDSHVSRIDLLATQADRVPTNQHKNMKKLLDAMHGAKARVVDGAKQYLGTVSAVSTTLQTADGKRVLLHGPFHNGNEEPSAPNRAVEFVDKEGNPSPRITVPEHWPCNDKCKGIHERNWREGEFTFPFTMPVFPESSNLVPITRGMTDEIQRLFDLTADK